MALLNTLRENRESILQIAAQHGAFNVRVFGSSALVQDAVLRRLQTIAESSQRLSKELKAQAPGVDWRSLAGFRNILVHDYVDGIDLERVIP
ncbi:MAG: DUF86 domain-containing protein, partial [Elainellaceae cyanobacterium]